MYGRNAWTINKQRQEELEDVSWRSLLRIRISCTAMETNR